MRLYGKLSIFFIVSVLGFIFFVILKNIITVNIFHAVSGELLSPIVGTVLITLFSVLIATPIGVITGIFISEYSSGKMREFFIFIFKMLSSLPSILYGLFGFIMILMLNEIFGTSLRTCFLVSGLSLSFLVLPYIVHATIIGFSKIDTDLKLLPLTLGAKKYQAVFKVYIFESIEIIFAGIALAIGRAAEDTAVIMLTGVAAFAGLPTSLFSPFEALPFFIFYTSQENVTEDSVKLIYLAALIIIFISAGFIVLSKRIGDLNLWKR